MLLEAPEGQENKGQGLSPAHPSASPPRRWGCSPAEPYPPGGQAEYTICFNFGLDSQEILELVAEAVTFANVAHPFNP